MFFVRLQQRKFRCMKTCLIIAYSQWCFVTTTSIFFDQISVVAASQCDNVFCKYLQPRQIYYKGYEMSKLFIVIFEILISTTYHISMIMLCCDYLIIFRPQKCGRCIAVWLCILWIFTSTTHILQKLPNLLLSKNEVFTLCLVLIISELSIWKNKSVQLI